MIARAGSPPPWDGSRDREVGRVLPSEGVYVRRLGFPVLVLGSLALAGVGTATAAPLAHHGDAIVRVQASPAEVEALGLDVWTHGTAEPSVVARVTLEQRALLDVSGLDYRVLDPDLGPRVAAERARLLAAPPVQGGLDPGFYDDYRSFDAVISRLGALVANRPDRVSHVELGLSLQGRFLRGVRITNPGAADRPVVVVQGCQHAREWISVAATVFAAEQFATAAEGTELDVLLDQVELVVVPVANPDGYVHSWQRDRYWRKNRRDGHGVDLNRNFGVAFGGAGSSGNPSSQVYRGAAPFSEPESEALQRLIESRRFAIHVDLHSYGQLILHPWSHTRERSRDHRHLSSLAVRMAEAIAATHGERYRPMSGESLYPASGTLMDWAYGTHGVASFVIELRPRGGTGFVLPPAQILPTCDEGLAAVLALGESHGAAGDR